MYEKKTNATNGGAETLADSLATAKAAGLRYVSDTIAGIRRRKAGKGFAYMETDGRLIRDPEIIRRIKALAIPPAWTDVWICPYANGHIQATARDARGRKQYRYHQRWREVRDQTKYDRLLAFGQALPKIRRKVAADLALQGMPREKILAVVVRLLETTFIRIGNQEYARLNKSFGLTTLRNRHVEVKGATLRFQFRGKSGKYHNIALTDKRLAKIIKRCQELPGQELFQYVDEAGQLQSIGSGEVNQYLRDITGEDFTAKDFRTWAGTVLAMEALQSLDEFASESEARKNLVQAVETVAEKLGNTPAVCRNCYIHPAIPDAYLDNSLRNGTAGKPKKRKPWRGLRVNECQVMNLLQRAKRNSRSY